jgi:hypothetical protein
MVQWSGAVLSSSGCRWQTGSIIASSTRKMLAAMVILPIRFGEFDGIASTGVSGRLHVYQHYNESARCAEQCGRVPSAWMSMESNSMRGQVQSNRPDAHVTYSKCAIAINRKRVVIPSEGRCGDRSREPALSESAMAGESNGDLRFCLHCRSAALALTRHR